MVSRVKSQGKTYRQTYSVEKVSEGGIGQTQAMRDIKQAFPGVDVRKGYSPYVGQSGMDVTATEAQHRKIEDMLFGAV